MNIFFLDEDPKTAARMLADIHVGCHNKGGKMIVESAQMLANCYPQNQLQKAPKTKKGNTRKYSYYNHPCSIWVRKSCYHFEWLLIHALEMVEEKMFRGGNYHFCGDVLEWFYDNPPYNMPLSSPKKPALAMPENFKNSDPIIAYRNYYKYDKMKNLSLTWTHRDIPYWIN